MIIELNKRCADILDEYDAWEAYKEDCLKYPLCNIRHNNIIIDDDLASTIHWFLTGRLNFWMRLSHIAKLRPLSPETIKIIIDHSSLL